MKHLLQGHRVAGLWCVCAAPLLTSCLWRQASAAADDRGEALIAPSLFVAQDSDDFNVRKVGAGFAPLYRSANDFMVVKAANHRYSTSDWAIDATQLTLARTAINARTGLGYQAAMGLNDMGGRQLLTADIDYSFALNGSTNAGLVFNRDWVETRKALENGISLSYFGGSLEHRFAPGWTAIGLLAQHRFSDDNVRSHVRIRMIHDLLPDQGVNVQYRHRHFWNSNAPNGNYFNPDAYYEDMLALGLRRRVSGWLLVGTLGAGLQKVSSDPDTPTRLAELEGTSPLTGRVSFRGRLGFSDSATFGGPNYIYRYLQADLIFSF
jgi:hypothetical protein